jgi:crotonobetainyl-CoA:carnitine CoA-transferase CaiB-like acyl-CoA transferase
MSGGEASGPLRGVRVIDLTRLLPGAFGTGVLADLGADVVKVEQPVVGDYMRKEEPKIGGESAYSWATDRNKRSISLNLKEPRGAEALKRLAASADALIESFRPGVMARLGLGYEELREVNPRLVYCSISGYGQDGPLRLTPGHDLNYIGRAGLLSITGTRERPVVPGVQIADMAAGGLMSCVGLLASVLRAREDGEGEYVDVAMCDGAFAIASPHAAAYLADEKVPGREQMPLNGGLPRYNVYECADGEWITVGAVEEKFFAALCEAIGRPDLIGSHDDPQAIPVWRQLFLEKPRQEWLDRLEPIDSCVGPVNDFESACADPQLRARQMVIELADRDGEPAPQTGTPIKFREHPASLRTAIPGLGEQTESLLAEAGFGTGEIAAMMADGVAYDASTAAADARPGEQPANSHDK